MNFFQKKNYGFTIIELIAVLVILGILIIFVSVSGNHYRAETIAVADTFKSNLRYAATRAMSQNKDIGIQVVYSPSASSPTSFASLILWERSAGTTGSFSRGVFPSGESAIEIAPHVQFYVITGPCRQTGVYFNNRGVPFSMCEDTSSISFTKNTFFSITSAEADDLRIDVEIDALTGYVK